ncbi:SsrA-binding protein SmpB [bacterium]|nr:SsrA-binding protein SmpB [bacterium]
MSNVATNRKAFADYEILEKYEAGIELLGSEVKSIREGNVNLRDSFAILRGSELYLLNCHISPYKQAGPRAPDPARSRKLLLHRQEINRLIGKAQQKGLTLVPLSLYFNKRNLVKVELALGKGKTHADRRQDIRKRDVQREIARALKHRQR